MSAPKDSGAAFPVHYQRDPNGCDAVKCGDRGMTLRDWFAGQALVGMGQWSPEGMWLFKSRADWAYQMADAMIAERNGGKRDE